MSVCLACESWRSFPPDVIKRYADHTITTNATTAPTPPTQATTVHTKPKNDPLMGLLKTAASAWFNPKKTGAAPALIEDNGNAEKNGRSFIQRYTGDHSRATESRWVEKFPPKKESPPPLWSTQKERLVPPPPPRE